VTATRTIDLAHDLDELATLAVSEDTVDDLVRRGLDWLGRLAPYDLATLFVLEGDRLVVRAARGPMANDRVRSHVLELGKFPSLREALESRRARTFLEEDHRHGDGDPFDHVLDLPPGHACLVAPLHAGGEPMGVLTLDRGVCEVYPQTVVNLVEVYAQLLAIALQRARQVARTHSPVLLLGERGTGKERLARAIHRWSPRSDQPFVTLHCGAVPPALLEVELFGQVGPSARTGRLALANGGTLFLDDVGELPAPLQAKLLRVLQAGEFEPMGSEAPVRVDARVIAATHVDLEASVAAGTFREDLYYPLGVFPLELPPLRERKEDIALLADALLLELAARTGKTGRRLTPEGLSRLQAHDWPGNVRELANVLERALILAPGETLGPEVLDLPGRRRRESRSIEPVTLAEATRQHIRRVLNLTEGRVYGPGGAAALLGLKPSTLQSKMKKLGMTRASPA